ncbi:hypothetical protein QCA50_018442 [Cerrena zonata]|uniref:F-box domain-containing protein n=1 Tax=Cerrena zonata TaxID=2478898 RepID=A0AAW0FB47_9APHY
MTTLTREDVLQEIQKCNEEIVEAERVGQATSAQLRLCLQKQILNSLLPISQLPDETLLEIFTAYCSQESETYIIEPFCAVRLTHICSRWRAVAIACPTLWNVIDLTWPAWTIDVIPRSKEAPLTVAFRGTFLRREPTRCIIEHILSTRSHQIVSFRMKLFCVTTSWLDEIPTSSMTALKTLVIGGFHPIFARGLHNSIQHIQVHSNWGQLVEPLLLLFRPNLHTLDLSLPDTESGQLSWRDCIRALGAMHFLRRLFFKNVFNGGLDTREPIARITLPLLIELSIKADIAACTMFIDHIGTPSLTTATVTAKRCQLIQEIDFFCLTISKMARFNWISSTSNRLMTKRSDTFVELSVKLYLDLEDRHLLNVCLEGERSFVQQLDLNPLVSRLDFPNVDYITIESFDPSLLILSRLPTITTLCLTRASLPYIPSLLRPRREGDTLFQPFPNFNKLIINRPSELKEQLSAITTTFQERTLPSVFQILLL